MICLNKLTFAEDQSTSDDVKRNKYWNDKLKKIEMLDTLNESLSQELIKQFHYELKSGVFEDRANGYAIGDYKKRPNMIGMYQTVRPGNVVQEMYLLMDWYNSQDANISVITEFHARILVVAGTIFSLWSVLGTKGEYVQTVDWFDNQQENFKEDKKKVIIETSL